MIGLALEVVSTSEVIASVTVSAEVVLLHVVTPTVPVPTLVNGRPA